MAGRLSSSCYFSRVAAGRKVFSHCLWADPGPGNSWGRMWSGFLRVAQQARVLFLSALSPDLSQLAVRCHTFPLWVFPSSLICPSVAPWPVCRGRGHGLT